MADLRGYVEGMIDFEGGGGTNVVANPTGTPTDDLETVQIGEIIYNIGGGGEKIVPTPTNVDRSKYLGVKSNANELEYRSINELPSSEGASAGTVLTHTISGDSWLPPAKELPTYTSGDNGKVLGIVNGALVWIPQGGAYTETSLFNGQTDSTGDGITITLDDNISDYDAIVIDCARMNEGIWRHGYIWYLTSDMSVGQWFLQIINVNDNNNAYWRYNSDTSIIWQSAYSAYPVTLFSIKGIKFGG